MAQHATRKDNRQNVTPDRKRRNAARVRDDRRATKRANTKSARNLGWTL